MLYTAKQLSTQFLKNSRVLLAFDKLDLKYVFYLCFLKVMTSGSLNAEVVQGNLTIGKPPLKVVFDRLQSVKFPGTPCSFKNF